MVEGDALARNNRPGILLIRNRRSNHYDLGCPVGRIPSLRPVGVSALIDSSVPVLESLALLQLSDCGGVLNHESIVGAPGGQLKQEGPLYCMVRT